VITPFSNESILKIAGHVAKIKRGGQSPEEKVEAIGAIVREFSPEEPRILFSRPVPQRRASIALAVPAMKSRNRIYIRPPIAVRELARQLGIQPTQLIAELINLNVLANINDTIEPDIASRVAERHGFVLEKERREEVEDVHTPEQCALATSSLEDLPVPVQRRKRRNALVLPSVGKCFWYDPKDTTTRSRTGSRRVQA
jgi:Translation initiation factor IF-2, N-terminal region